MGGVWKVTRATPVRQGGLGSRWPRGWSILLRHARWARSI